MHMAIHRAVFKSDSNNLRLGAFVMNLLCGISWKRHHEEADLPRIFLPGSKQCAFY